MGGGRVCMSQGPPSAACPDGAVVLTWRAGVTTALMGYFHFSFAWTVVFMILCGIFLEVCCSLEPATPTLCCACSGSLP